MGKNKETVQADGGEKKDTAEKEFVSYPDIAEDVINALLYQGENVADQDRMISGPTESVYQGLERLRSQYADLCKYEMLDGRINLVYLIANQSNVDGKAVLRKAGYTGGLYREQYENKMPNLFPVVEIVLYWGKARWRKNRDSRELFKRRQIPEGTWKYVDELKVHVFEMRHLTKEIRELFKSDMRIVVDYLAEGKGYRSNRKIVHKAALIKMINALSGERTTDEDVKKWLEECRIKEEDEVKVCELFDQYERKGRIEGRAEGRTEGRAEGISQGLVKGWMEAILELLEDLGEIPEKIKEKIFGEKDMTVLKRWHKAAARAGTIKEFQDQM